VAGVFQGGRPLKFVARLREGEKMAVLCREFDISRKTGYKIFSRYKDCGLEGLTDRSGGPSGKAAGCPFRYINQPGTLRPFSQDVTPVSMTGLPGSVSEKDSNWTAANSLLLLTIDDSTHVVIQKRIRI